MLANKRMDKGRSAASSVTLDSLIPEDHIIRKIDAAIDWEHRCAPMRDCYNRERGRHAFEPEVLLAIALWRHVFGVDSLRAAAAEMLSLPVSQPATTTPTAIPSGRLCSATASTIMVDFPRLQGAPSGQELFKWRWGMI